jgi:Uma2 family endonuclease
MSVMPKTRPDGVPINPEENRRMWTRTDYDQMATAGLIEEGAPYELVEGDIVAKMTQDRKHVAACTRTLRVATRIFGAERVQSQAPIALDQFNEPEPDIAVLKDPVDSYLTDDPGPADVLLVVEISNSSFLRDRDVKSHTYARSGILEYWLVNIRARSLIVHRAPTPAGYEDVFEVSERETIAPLAAPDARALVADLLPPAA